jgi:hypothetical protein
VDDEQVQDRIDDALQYWQDYHFDGLQKFYYIKKIDQTDVNQKYLDLSNVVDDDGKKLEIVGLSRIFPIQDSQASVNMFDLRYQLRLNELYDFTSASYVNYTLTMQHLRSLELMFSGEVPIRFNRHMQRLYIDWAWGRYQAPVGTVVVAECYASINPDVYPEIWDDRWLKRYATALIKRAWGANMKKFGGLQLPGGVMLNGKETFDEAEEEIKMLEQEMQDKYELPAEWFMN